MRIRLALTAAVVALGWSASSQTVVPQAPAKTITAQFRERMTPEQIEHSKLFSNFSQDAQVLEDSEVGIVHTRSSDSPNHGFGFPIPDDAVPEAKPSMQTVVDELACGSDAVFVAAAIDSVSNPTADGTFLFTDSRVRVSEVLLSKVGTLPSGAIVTVTRPGGEVRVPPTGRVVRHVPPAFPLLDQGQRYVFFTKYVQATRAYRSHELTGTFRLDRNFAVPLWPLDAAPDAGFTGGFNLDDLKRRINARRCK